ncbi:MAG: S41 family peptidase [Dysgonamonadaceae bacterium]|nr:S41 family peptidase [Dysgonamonadaceae bacterium]
MRKLSSLLLITLTLLFVVTSCSDKDDPIIDKDKGVLIRATFDPSTKTFTLKYSKGATETVDATIDNSVTPPTATATLKDGTIISMKDATKDGEATIGPIPPKPDDKSILLISQFVYDGLSSYYLWSNEMLDKKPTVNDTDPVKYFKSVLYKTDTDNGWSWITDDAKGLVADFAGEPKSFGYSLSFLQINNAIYAFVKYVYANTPASNAGLQRLDLIGKLNGNPITTETGSNYINQRDIEILYGSNTATFTTYKLTDQGIVQDKEIQITPATIKTDPVLFDKVYTIGNKKIGYLFYTSYISNYNDRLFEVFSNFKNEGVTELVLDLRYNPGGAISAASYLVSLFAPETSVKEKDVLTTLSYNQFLNDYFGSDRNTTLGTYQENDEYDKEGKLLRKAAPNPLAANLNLNKVYIIATEGSASASELTTFCSRPIMGESNVIHIGGRTSGKYTGSWTIHPYDRDIGQPIYDESKLSVKDKKTFENWAMQPIVAIYTDKNGKNFINPGYLEPDFPLKEGFGYIDYWKPLGDTEDVLLGQALYLITGDESYKPIEPVSTRSNQEEMIKVATRSDEAKPVLIDNVKLPPENFKEITRMRNIEN